MDQRFDVFEEILDSYYEIVRTLAKYYQEPREYGTHQKVTVMEVHMLKEIAKSPRTSITDLTVKLHKTKGAISQVIEKLALKGLVQKENDPEDTRKKRLVLTEDGRTICEYHNKLDQEFFLRVFKHMPQATKEDLEDYLEKHGKVLAALHLAIEEDKKENIG